MNTTNLLVPYIWLLFLIQETKKPTKPWINHKVFANTYLKLKNLQVCQGVQKHTLLLLHPVQLQAHLEAPLLEQRAHVITILRKIEGPVQDLEAELSLTFSWWMRCWKMSSSWGGTHMILANPSCLPVSFFPGQLHKQIPPAQTWVSWQPLHTPNHNSFNCPIQEYGKKWRIPKLLPTLDS